MQIYKLCIFNRYACVCGWLCVFMYVLRIVSLGKILCFINTCNYICSTVHTTLLQAVSFCRLGSISQKAVNKAFTAGLEPTLQLRLLDACISWSVCGHTVWFHIAYGCILCVLLKVLFTGHVNCNGDWLSNAAGITTEDLRNRNLYGLTLQVHFLDGYICSNVHSQYDYFCFKSNMSVIGCMFLKKHDLL